MLIDSMATCRLVERKRMREMGEMKKKDDHACLFILSIKCLVGLTSNIYMWLII